MDSLIKKIKSGKTVLLYGFTPPRATHSHDKIMSISQRRISRLNQVNVDGLVIYDIQDEASRKDETRPFPFLETVDSLLYRDVYLKDLNLPSVVYQCVGKYNPSEMAERIERIGRSPTVFVGAPSHSEAVKCSLSHAYNLYKKNPVPYLGGVTIPERHSVKGDEHSRLFSKIDRGAVFFISQFIFNVEKLKNLLSDYYYASLSEGYTMAPVIFTVTPCGSQKTLDLLIWLGVDIPVWVRNDLVYSSKTLERSLDFCTNSVKELSQFCLNLGIPFGCNVESVSLGRDEVLASFELVNRINDYFSETGIRVN